jgi:hypothetical protein
VTIAAGEPSFLVTTEMKLTFTLALVLRAVDRPSAADEVRLAVRASSRGRDRDSRVRKVCRLLGFGLLSVLPSNGRVEVLVEPGPHKRRPDKSRRSPLLDEHGRRQGDPTHRGSVRRPIMTTYRRRAPAGAEKIKAGPQPVSAPRPLAPDAGAILLRNVYGWFERESRGMHRLTAFGHAALSHWLAVPAPEEVPAPALDTAWSAARRSVRDL